MADLGELSRNPRPEKPRPPMTFGEQADLLEYLHGRCTFAADGKSATLVITVLDRDQIDDLWLIVQRLRRMAPHENEIRRVVTGR